MSRGPTPSHRAAPRVAHRVAATENLLALRVGDFWRFFWKQNFAFAGLCLYLVVEYVRPQQLFDAIYGWPLGNVTLGMAMVGYLVGGAKGFGLKGAGSVLLLLFTAVIVISSVGAYDPDRSFANLSVWISWVVIYFLIVNVVDTEKKFVFFIVLWLMCHVYMAQGGTRQFMMRGFRFASWGITGAPGWFANSGEFGIAMAMFTSVSWHLYAGTKQFLSNRRKAAVLIMPIMGLLCVIGSSSRGAVLALIAIGLCALARTKINFRTIVGVGAIAGAVWFIIPPEQKARFSEVGEDKTSVMRKVYWLNGLEMAKAHPVFGVGYENWLPVYAAYYRESAISQQYEVFTVQVAHNIFIQCMAELGYTGLAVFLLLIIATPTINYRTRKLARAGPDPAMNSFLVRISFALDEAMLCYLIAGFFVTVLYYPFFWINLALTVALHAVARARTQHVPARRRPAVRPQSMHPHSIPLTG
jgi:putative inorganic carbon (hco3(-)) transporter